MVKFAQIDELKRERDVEGESGVDLRVFEGVFIHVLCQSDANTRFRAFASKKLREIKRLRNAGATPEELDAELAAFLFDCVVKGWRGVKDEDGNEVECTRANFITWCCQHPRAMGRIDEYSNDETNFRSNKDDGTKDRLKN